MATNGHSGYPLKWFVDQNAARDSWECAICLEVLKDPVQVRDCGHQFCALCIDDILKADPHCPSCRIEISKAVVFEDHAARRLIKKMDVNCCNEGCYWVGNLSSLLQTHIKSCNFLVNVVNNDNGKQSDVEELKAKLESLTTEVSNLNEMHKTEMEQANLQHQNELRRLALKHEADIKEMKIKYETDLKKRKTEMEEANLQHQNELRRLALKHEADIKEMKIKYETDLKKVDGKRPPEPPRQGLVAPANGHSIFQPQKTNSHKLGPYDVQGCNAQPDPAPPQFLGDDTRDRPVRSFITMNKNKKKHRSTKLTKEDIGLPTNFQHVGHVGWDPQERFDNKETAKFINDFVEKHSGLESFNAENRELPPPPPSSDMPPPPPARGNCPPRGVPAPPPPNRGYSVPAPPPLSRRSSEPPSPPLPPPPNRGSSAPLPPPHSRRSWGPLAPPPPNRGYSAPPPPTPSRESSAPPPTPLSRKRSGPPPPI